MKRLSISILTCLFIVLGAVFISSNVYAGCSDSPACVVLVHVYTPQQDVPRWITRYSLTNWNKDIPLTSVGKNVIENVYVSSTYYFVSSRKYYFSSECNAWYVYSSQYLSWRSLDELPPADYVVSSFDPNVSLPLGCASLPPPPDPCDSLEKDVDTDSDGICDRCDYAPQDAQYGRTLYALFSTYNSDTGAHISSTCTAFPADIYGSMDSVTQSVFTNDIGRPAEEGEPIKIQSGFHEPIAYMTPCVCDKPCQPLFNEPENFSDNPDPIAGTDPVPTGETPTTVPQPTPENLTPGTIDPVGEHGTTTKDTGDPLTDNTGIIGDILDSELNELNAGMRKTAGELNELTTKLDQGFELKVDSSGIQENSYDSSVEQPAEDDLSSVLGNFIASGLPYSDVVKATRAEVADSDPTIRYTYNGQEIIIGDFTDYQFILQIMGAAVVAASLLLSYFIVVGKS